jgi:hypothetical protein
MRGSDYKRTLRAADQNPLDTVRWTAASKGTAATHPLQAAKSSASVGRRDRLVAAAMVEPLGRGTRLNVVLRRSFERRCSPRKAPLLAGGSIPGSV